MNTKFYTHYRRIPKGIWRWKNFTPKEIASKGDGSILIDFDALDKLQLARDIVGKPFSISSAYRDESHNRKVGGARASYHLLGRAFDIKFKGHNKKELVDALIGVGFNGFGIYDTFVHADTREDFKVFRGDIESL